MYVLLTRAYQFQLTVSVRSVLKLLEVTQLAFKWSIFLSAVWSLREAQRQGAVARGGGGGGCCPLHHHVERCRNSSDFQTFLLSETPDHHPPHPPPESDWFSFSCGCRLEKSAACISACLILFLLPLHPTTPRPTTPLPAGRDALLIGGAAEGAALISAHLQTEKCFVSPLPVEHDREDFREAALPDGRLFLHGYCLRKEKGGGGVKGKKKRAREREKKPHNVSFICAETYQTFLHAILRLQKLQPRPSVPPQKCISALQRARASERANGGRNNSTDLRRRTPPLPNL